MRILLPVAALAAILTASAGAAPSTRISFADTLRAGAEFSLSTTTQERSSFEVVLRVPRHGRAQVFLSGRNAPRGGPLIDTTSYSCPARGRSRFCLARYEPLPRGVYRWRVRWLGEKDGFVELTVRW